MDHIHNETVLAFMQEYKNHPNVKAFLRKQNKAIRLMNEESGSDYHDYLDYLQANIGDDAGITMAESEALLRPLFKIKLSNIERKEFEYKDFGIAVDKLTKPVCINQ